MFTSNSNPRRIAYIIVNIPSCLPGNHNKEGKMAAPSYFVSDFSTEGWCEPRARIGKVVIEMQCGVITPKPRIQLIPTSKIV